MFESSSLCQIVSTSNSDLHSFICSACEARLRLEYKNYLTLKISKEKVDFEFFLAYFTGEQLRDMAAFGTCEHGLSENGYVMDMERLVAAFNRLIAEKGMELVSEGIVPLCDNLN